MKDGRCSRHEKGRPCRRPIDSRVSTRRKINCGNARAPAILARWTKKKEDKKITCLARKKDRVTNEMAARLSLYSQEEEKRKLNGISHDVFSILVRKQWE